MDGASVDLLVHQFSGPSPGPSLYVGASTHGNELQGVEILRQLAKELNPATLRGNVTFIPIQNPLAFQNRVRLNPIDGKDLDIVYPGREDGSATEKLASVLFSKFASKANCVIDLHSGGICSKNIPHIYVPSEIPSKCAFSSMELASAFGADALIDTQKGKDFHFALDNLSPYYCNRATGAAGLYVELGEGGIVDNNHVQFGKTGVLNVLKKLGMLEGAIDHQGKQTIVKHTTVVTSGTSGLIRYNYELGDSVHRGDILGEVNDIDGSKESIRSPSAGIVQWTIRNGSVNAGEHICWIGGDDVDD